MDVDQAASEIYSIKDEESGIYSVLADTEKPKILGGAILYVEKHGILSKTNAIRLYRTVKNLDQLDDNKIEYVDVENFLEGLHHFGLLKSRGVPYRLDGEPPFRDYRLDQIENEEILELIEAGSRARQQKQVSTADMAPKTF